MQGKKKLILFELNEVPPRILNEFLETTSLKGFKKLRNEGTYFETICKDKGELHPWSTWPTIHRGVNNNLHKINFINQPLEESINYPPVWEILSKNKISIGIFGSLQSYPPLENKFVKFYLPDTFSPSYEAIPKKLEEFQRFNLTMAGENKAISGKIKTKHILQMISLIFKRNFSFKTIFQFTKHLIFELLQKKYKKRRHFFQSILSFDIYFKNLKKYKPEYSSFFSNHVASSMHRYWLDVFPNDFNKIKGNSFNKNTIIEAMKIADIQLNKLINFCDKNDYSLILLSSMGQDKIQRDDLEDLILDSFRKLCNFLNLDFNDYILKPAMQPDICIAAKNESAMFTLLESISKIKDTDQNNLIVKTYGPINLSTNIGLRTTKILNINTKVLYNNELYPLSETGLKLIKRDIGTGYHIPIGIGMAYGSIAERFTKINNPINTTKILPEILSFFNIKDHG